MEINLSDIVNCYLATNSKLRKHVNSLHQVSLQTIWAFHYIFTFYELSTETNTCTCFHISIHLAHRGVWVWVCVWDAIITIPTC